MAQKKCNHQIVREGEVKDLLELFCLISEGGKNHPP